jgi:hypothetical protein
MANGQQSGSIKGIGGASWSFKIDIAEEDRNCFAHIKLKGFMRRAVKKSAHL